MFVQQKCAFCIAVIITSHVCTYYDYVYTIDLIGKYKPDDSMNTTLKQFILPSFFSLFSSFLPCFFPSLLLSFLHCFFLSFIWEYLQRHILKEVNLLRLWIYKKKLQNLNLFNT